MSIPDRVQERRRGVMLARYDRETEGLAVAEIARRLGRSPGTVRAYFYDPMGDKAWRRKAQDWPAPATVTERFGTWAAARADAFPDDPQLAPAV